jgi:hypothetical protein
VTSTREREQNIAETVRVVGDAVCAVASMPLPIGDARPLLACSVYSCEVSAMRCRRLPITGALRGGAPRGQWVGLSALVRLRERRRRGLAADQSGNRQQGE